jgi:uncharacterized protein (DUF58 family)
MNRPGFRITSIGTTVLVAGVSVVVLGYVFGYRSLTVAGVAVLLGAIIAALTTTSVPALQVARVIEPQRVARGNPAHGLVSVKNVKGHRSKPCSAIEAVGDRSVHVAIPGLGSRKSIAVSYELATQRRGELLVGPLSIQRRDPFGLFEVRKTVGEKVSVLVEPNIYPIDPRPAGRLRHLEGPRSDKAQGTMTFHSLREYTRGDDIRRVHWRSSARTGTLMVKEHVDTSLPSTVVVIDTNASHYSGDLFEDAVDVAASVVTASQGRNFPVRFMTTSGATLFVRAGQRGQELRDALASLMPDDVGTLHRATSEVLRCHDHDTIVIVGGTLDVEDLVQVSSMARRFSTAVLVTLRASADGRPVWNAGTHLDGDSAKHVMTSWQFGATTDSIPVHAA